MCILCQQTSPKCLFGNRTMTSFCDVTNSAHQIQITTLCHWMKPRPWKVSAYATASTSGFTIIYQLFFWVLASGPPAVARTVDPFSEVCPCLKTLITPLNVTYIFREGNSFRPTSARSEVPCWQHQLGCEWKISKLWDRSSRILSQLASNNVLAQPSVHFSVGLLRTKFQVPNIPVYDNIVNKSIIYQ